MSFQSAVMINIWDDFKIFRRNESNFNCTKLIPAKSFLTYFLLILSIQITDRQETLASETGVRGYFNFLKW